MLAFLLGFDADLPYEETEEVYGEINGLFWFGERPKTAAEVEQEEAEKDCETVTRKKQGVPDVDDEEDSGSLWGPPMREARS